MNNTKLTGFPLVLRRNHEITRDKIPEIMNTVENLEKPEKMYAPSLDKKWSITGPILSNNNPIFKIEFVENITISELLKQALVNGGTEGFFGVMLLYQYYYNLKKLGKPLNFLEPQQVINTVMEEKAYKLNSKDCDRLCRLFISLKGIDILHKNNNETKKSQKNKEISKDEVIYSRYSLFNYNHLVFNEKTGNIVKLKGNIRFMDGLFKETMNGEDYKKISRIFIPAEDILKISSDKRSKGKAVFLNLICLDLSHIAQYGKSEKDYDLDTCIKYAQWTTDKKKKTKLWTRILKILDDAKKVHLISYIVFYVNGKTEIYRNISFVRVRREFSINKECMSIMYDNKSLGEKIIPSSF